MRFDKLTTKFQQALADRYRATARKETEAADPAEAERAARAIAARVAPELARLGFVAPRA